MKIGCDHDVAAVHVVGVNLLGSNKIRWKIPALLK